MENQFFNQDVYNFSDLVAEQLNQAYSGGLRPNGAAHHPSLKTLMRVIIETTQ